MHAAPMIQKILTGVMHLKRLNSLIDIVRSAFEARQLSVTGLGRALLLPIQERSGIRKVDRLVGNKKLHDGRQDVYKITSQQLVGSKKRPWIIVDWSPVPNSTHQLLRAALVCEGRALSVYEEVHPGSKLGNRKVQESFLASCKKMLPTGCCPIIVTDAGFHAPWFNAVRKQGWDFVGRVRGTVTYCPEGERKWVQIKGLYPSATKTAKRFGLVTLSKTTPCEGVLCYYKGLTKGRVNKNKLGCRRGSKDSENRARSAKEPWLLMTSLDGHQVAKKVIQIYKRRMQIEEGFRDLKSSKYGFGFEQARSRKIARIENLLLIAMLASFIAWVIGWLAEKENLHYQYQANSIKNRRVLSLFYLGCRVIKKKMKLKHKAIGNITRQLEWAENV